MRVDVILAGVVLSCSFAAVAHADRDRDRRERSSGFFEGVGGWGVQFGRTDYLPDGSATDFKHPFVSGWSAGANAGVFVGKKVALYASYQYRWASSREGDIPGVLDRVQGEIRYHSIVGGVRLYHRLGPGFLRAELGAGVALPFETRLEYDYGPGLAAAGITGDGVRIDEYCLGIGGQAALTYENPLSDRAYLAYGVEMRAFQSRNSCERTRYRNFVPDFTASPPESISATVEYGDGRARPTTFAAQDVGARLALGVRF